MLEVSCRLWVSCVVGRRTYSNVKLVIGTAIERGRYSGRILFTSDGFEPYGWTVKAMHRFICVYAQVMKKRCKDRVIHIERKLISGTHDQLEQVLFNSEDSQVINTSFIERHNLSIRMGSSYLCRRTACHAKRQEYLDANIALLKCHYNFIRPHLALRFGKEIRTPVMQAGLVSKKLAFRDIFTTREVLFLCLIIMVLGRRVTLARRAEWSALTTVP